MNMTQLHIFSIKSKLDMRLFVNFCVSPRFSLNSPELNLKLFSSAVQNNFRFSSGKVREKWGKTQKSTNNLTSSFGLIEKCGFVSYLLSCTILGLKKIIKTE